MSANKSKELAVKIMRLTGGYPCEESELQKSLESLLDEALREAEQQGFIHRGQTEVYWADKVKEAYISQIQKDAEMVQSFVYENGLSVKWLKLADDIREQGKG